MQFLKIILLFTTFLLSIKSKNVILDVKTNVATGFFTISISLGTPPKDFEYPINTYISFTNLPLHNYDNSYSSSYELITTNEIEVNGNKQISDIVEESVLLSNKYSINNYRYYLSQKPISHTWDEGFGFGLAEENDTMSLINLLYNTNQIDKKQLFIFPRGFFRNNKEKGVLLLGEPNSSLRDSYKYFGKCKVDKNESKWGCFLENIKIGKKTFDFNLKAIFSSCQFYAVLSTEFFIFAANNIFQKHIEQGQCNKMEGFVRDRIICSQEVINNFGEVDFTFSGGMSIKVPISKMFECKENKCNSLFSTDYLNNSTFQFGVHFLQLFDKSGYDFTAKEVSFFSNQIDIKMVNNNYLSFEKKLYFLFYAFCFFGIIIIVASKKIK